MNGRIFAIGDIHGCKGRLERLLEIMLRDFEPETDSVVFIGDYIDRGAESKGTVDTILDFVEERPGTVCLRGNHEQMLLDHLSGENRRYYLLNGGARTLEEYSVAAGADASEIIPGRHRSFFENLPYSFETEEYIFVHAGLRPGAPLESQSPRDLLWIREEFLYVSFPFDKTIVFGHTPFAEPFMEGNKLGIDTGAVYGGKLTCVELPSRNLIQV